MVYSPEVLKSLTSESKSQIAIEYAYRLRKKWPARSVFWVHANNAARFEQSYRNIATATKIPGIEDPKVDVLNLVSQWLGSSESGDWLLILDNADDADMFFGPLVGPTTQSDAASIEPPCLSRFLPQTGTGSILVTSRDEGTAFRLTGGRKQVLRVDIMSEDDTMALLTNKLPEDPSDNSAKKELIIELGSVPLAVTQASAYITVQGSRMTVAKYLQLLRHDEKNQIDLLSKNEVDLRRDPGVPNSVIRTWQISFSQIKDQNPAAADLLSCMCMLDRQGIPEFLFCEDGDQSLNFEEAIGTLLRFSFVIQEQGNKGFAIHRLVQLATRKWLEAYGEMGKAQEEALRLISDHYPVGTYENWTVCEALEPHAQVVLKYTYDSEACKLQQSDILYNGASYAGDQGRFNITEEKVQKAIDIQMMCLDSDDSITLSSLHRLAATYRKQGRWTEAEALNIQVLEIRKRVLGAEHENTLTTMGNLALTYQEQGRWTEAEALNIQVLEIRKRVSGAEHQNTLFTMGNLALTYQEQGRWSKAEALEVQVLEIRTRVFGVEHPDTLITMNNLASTYGDQGRWTQAEELDVQVLEISKRVLGVEHPNTLITMGNLASTYSNQGRWAEAEELKVQVLETRRRVSGAEHPETLAIMNSLASTYLDQKRWTEAEELGVQVLEISKRVLGAEHPDTLAIMNSLASTYLDQKRWTEAEELEVQLLETRRRVLGAEHPDTLTAMNNLAHTYYALDRHDEAITLMEQVIELQEKIQGANHPHTISSIDTLAGWRDS